MSERGSYRCLCHSPLRIIEGEEEEEKEKEYEVHLLFIIQTLENLIISYSYKNMICLPNYFLFL
jgi:hypothetical protein